MHDDLDLISEDASPIPWTRTNAAIEWWERTKSRLEFSDKIEDALAEDYFQNSLIYTDEVLDSLSAWHLAVQSCELEVDQVLKVVKELSLLCANDKPSA